jgi:hypothetical protein
MCLAVWQVVVGSDLYNERNVYSWFFVSKKGFVELVATFRMTPKIVLQDLQL